jgi:hypothetical protein
MRDDRIARSGSASGAQLVVKASPMMLVEKTQVSVRCRGGTLELPAILPRGPELVPSGDETARDRHRAAFLAATDKRRLSALVLDRQLGIGDHKSARFLPHEPKRAMVNANRTNLGGIAGIDGTFVGGCQPGLTGGRQQKGRKAAMVLVAVGARPHTFVGQKTGPKIGHERSARAREALIVRPVRADA